MRFIILPLLILLTIATTSMAELTIHKIMQVDTIGKATLQYVNTGFWTYNKITVKCNAYDIDDKLIGYDQYVNTGLIVPGFALHAILDIELGEMMLHSIHCKTWEQ